MTDGPPPSPPDYGPFPEERRLTVAAAVVVLAAGTWVGARQPWAAVGRRVRWWFVGVVLGTADVHELVHYAVATVGLDDAAIRLRGLYVIVPEQPLARRDDALGDVGDEGSFRAARRSNPDRNVLVNPYIRVF